jgi:hypothetical protein
MMADEKTSLFDRVVAMAEELGLEGDEKNSYIDQHMTKAGWTRRPVYDPPGEGDSGNKKQASWF